MYFPAEAIIGNIKFNKFCLIEKVLHDSQRSVLLHVETNPIYFAEIYSRVAQLIGIFKTQPGMFSKHFFSLFKK